MSNIRRFSGTTWQQKVTVTLVRDGFNQPWGFRLAGGSDLGMPLTVQRALAGTPSEGELRPGDVLCKIGDYDARNLTHTEAQNLFKNAGNNIAVVVQRQGSVGSKPSSAPMSPPLASPPVVAAAPAPKPPVTGGVATPFAAAAAQHLASTPKVAPAPVPAPAYAPLQVQTNTPPASSVNSILSPGIASKSPRLPNNDNYVKTLQSPVQNLPVTVFPPPLPGFTPNSGLPRRPLTPTPFASTDPFVAPECLDNQPYRTTPLVLPGAKTKREVPITSYLRHHPNPAVRASPHHFDGNVDVLMKQKVADTMLERVVGPESTNKMKVVHQFNSPIALYSDQNIVEAVQQTHTGVTPYKGKKTLYYDPAKSETFKALKESELGDTVMEVPTPIQPKVFTPQKHVQPPLHQMQRNQAQKSPQPTNHINPLCDEKIHQSYSFRRLMNEVLGESDF